MLQATANASVHALATQGPSMATTSMTLNRQATNRSLDTRDTFVDLAGVESWRETRRTSTEVRVELTVS